MLNIEKGQRVTVWSVEDKGNYSLVQMSSSRKDKTTNEYKNSGWSFVKFVGEAHKKAKSLNRQDRIVLKGASLSREPYTKDGETVYAKNAQLTVFDWGYQEENQNSNTTDFDAVPNVTSYDEDSNPF